METLVILERSTYLVTMLKLINTVSPALGIEGREFEPTTGGRSS